MHYRIVQNPHDDLWRWTLIDGGCAVARSLDAPSFREALQRGFPDARAWQERTHNGARMPFVRSQSAVGAAPSAAPVDPQYEDVGWRRNDAPQAPDGEVEPVPMAQIGR